MDAYAIYHTIKCKPPAVQERKTTATRRRTLSTAERQLRKLSEKDLAELLAVLENNTDWVERRG